MNDIEKPEDHEIIYLQNPDDVIDDYEVGRTWCCDEINNGDTKYIRYDLYETLQAELASIKEQVDNTTNRVSINDITKILNNHQMFYQLSPVAAREIWDLFYKPKEEI